jgi:lysyl-tRNA synthetase, class II
VILLDAAIKAQEHEGLRLFRFIPGYNTNIVFSGKEPLFLILLSFLITFALTRLYTRLARIYGWGSGSVNGVHLHHMVVGIIMVLVAGFLGIAASPGYPWDHLLAIAFGVGAALTLDEFALWLYFRDVYWSEQGRSSIDATIMGIVLAGLVLVGTSPFGIHQAEAEEPRTVAFIVIAASIVFTIATFLKGRLMLGLISVFFPPVGLVCAFRLAKPHSPWSRWCYSHEPRRLQRSHDRFDERDRRLLELKDRLYDLIGGAPTSEQAWRPAPQVDLVDGYLSVRNQDDAPAEPSSVRAGGSPGV